MIRHVDLTSFLMWITKPVNMAIQQIHLFFFFLLGNIGYNISHPTLFVVFKMTYILTLWLSSSSFLFWGSVWCTR